MAVRIIDTFPKFREYWSNVSHKPLDGQVETWSKSHMDSWPEFLAKQIEDYSLIGEDWRQIAREMVFPYLEKRLPAMTQARENLLTAIPEMYEEAGRVFNFRQNLVCVIYVGIGCGAGWVTTLEEKPAILFGLENIAECGFEDKPILDGLVAHELGHVIHFCRREEGRVPKGEGAWWQLYSEGFAQRCEHLILGQDTWHMQVNDQMGDWLDWCSKNQATLAQKFILDADSGQSVRDYFGSWFVISDRRQTGYFLGHEAIRFLEKNMTLEEIAILDRETYSMRTALEALIIER